MQGDKKYCANYSLAERCKYVKIRIPLKRIPVPSLNRIARSGKPGILLSSRTPGILCSIALAFTLRFDTMLFSLRWRPQLKMHSPHLINTLSKLTPEAVERIWESTILPNLLVGFEDFCSWHEADQLPIEYSSDTRKITILAPPCPVHQKLEDTMNICLEEMATNLTNEGEMFSSQI